MQYFKHMGTMRHDVKIKRLINKYGIKGYGLYNLILESITEKLTTESPLPELQETCDDIAEFYNGNSAEINEIANFMLLQGLFELNEISGRITCNKIYKFLEQNQTRSKQIRTLIKSWKDKKPELLEYNASETALDKSDRTEQNRTEQNRTEQIPERNIIPPTFDMVKRYCTERNNNVNPQKFIDHYQARGWKPKGYTQKMTDWQAAVRTWEGNKQEEKQINTPRPPISRNGKYYDFEGNEIN